MHCHAHKDAFKFDPYISFNESESWDAWRRAMQSLIPESVPPEIVSDYCKSSEHFSLSQRFSRKQQTIAFDNMFHSLCSLKLFLRKNRPIISETSGVCTNLHKLAGGCVHAAAVPESSPLKSSPVGGDVTSVRRALPWPSSVLAWLPVKDKLSHLREIRFVKVATPLTRHESEPVRCGRLLPECLYQKQQLFWKTWSASTWPAITVPYTY